MHRIGLLLPLVLAIASSVSPAVAQDVGTPVTFGGAFLSGSFGIAAVPGALLFRSGASDPIPVSYDTVLFHGILPGPGIEFEFAREDASGAWSPWAAAPVHLTPNGRFWARGEFASPGNGRLRLRAFNRGSQAAYSVTLFSLEVYLRGAARPGGVTAIPIGISSATSPLVIGREDWGARPPKGEFVPHVPARMTQHHTAGRRTETLAQSRAEVRFIQDFHQNGRGWTDIGYHFLIDPSGRVFEGRPINVVGAHVKNENTGNVGIVLLGFHHAPYNHPVSPQQYQTLKDLGRWLISGFGIPAATYKGHRDLGATDCPGDLLYAALDRIRNSFSNPPKPPTPSILRSSPRVPPERLFDGSVSER